MIIQWIVNLGPWAWLVMGAIFLAVEILSPGIYFLWLGIAALLTGLLSLQLWETSLWSWQVQTVVFLVLALASVLIGRRFTNNSTTDSDQPLLNQRGQQLVGRTSILEEPIEEGYGRIRLGDTLWRVAGPDLPAGARVRIVSSNGTELKVEPM